MVEEKTEKTQQEKEKDRVTKERESIDVTNNKKEEEKVEVKEEEVEEKEEVVEKEEKLEASNEKVEELEEELEDKTLTAKERERLERRIQKEREKGKTLRDENEALKRQLEAKPKDGEKTYTEEEVNKLAETKAGQLLLQNEFKASVSRIAESCKKIDKEFSEKVTAMVEDVSGTGSALPAVMVGILDDLPNNGGPVLMHLANNVEEYEELYQLNPIRMALKLKEISDNVIATEKKAKQKKISEVPEVKEALKGKGTTPEQRANEKDTMTDFVRKRNAEVEARRREKAGLH